MFRFNSLGFFIASISCLCFINESIGFDFYSHASSYYFYDYSLNFNDVFFGNVVFPRYLMLSYFYEFFSRVGIPLGYFVLFLIFWLNYNVGKYISLRFYSNGYPLYCSLILFFMAFLSFFYSGLSLCLLFLLAFLVSGRYIFLFGGILHPVGFLMFSICLFCFYRKAFFRFLLLFLIFLLFLYCSTSYQFFTASLDGFTRFDISFDTFLKIMIEVFRRKYTEIIIAVFFVFIAFFSRTFIGDFFSGLIYFKVSKGVSLLLPLFFLLFVVFFMFGKPSLFYSILSMDINDVVYIAWFDFGDKYFDYSDRGYLISIRQYK